MLHLKRLKQAIISTTSKSRIIDRVRRLLWRSIKPYYKRLMADFEERVRQLVDQRLTSRVGGLHKDIMAVGYRLASIEDTLSDRAQAEIPVQQLAERVHALETALADLRSELPESVHALETALAELRTELPQRVESLQQVLEREMPRLNQIESMISSAIQPRDPLDEDATFRLDEGSTLSITGTPFVFASSKYGRFLLRHPDLISDAIMRGEFWDPHLKKIIEETGGPDRVAIDAGAYIGLHSIYMSHYFGQVYSFEPQEQMYQILCANVLLNGRRNVRTFNAALYDRPGYMRLASPNKQEVAVPIDRGEVDYNLIENAAALVFEMAGEDAAGAVRAVTIDSLGLDRVGLIKVDTQGADLHVLESAKQTIARCRPTIVFEFEKHLTKVHGNELADYERFFHSLSYELLVLHTDSEGKQIDYLAKPE